MAGSPPVLILDEPTNDLDPQRRKLVWDILRRINSEQKNTIYYSFTRVYVDYLLVYCH
jgi:ABC-2 type transport system ATP-binding protein